MKKLLNFIIVLTIFSIAACNSGRRDKGKEVAIDSTKPANRVVSKDTSGADNSRAKDANDLYCTKEKLSGKEIQFMDKLKKENGSIIYFDEINRFYAKKDNKLVFSRVVIPPDSLISQGYLYFDFTFFGDLSDIHILYSFNQGAAFYGEGSVIGDDTTNYFHTVIVYGTTGKGIYLYSNGHKLYTHEYDLK